MTLAALGDLDQLVERTMYLRFVAGADWEHHRRLQGVFADSYALKNRILYGDGLEPQGAWWLLETLDWLDENLPVPPFRESAWPEESVCWFKAEANESINRMWALTRILREHGHLVRVLKTRNPGKVLFEDDHQLVVIQWRQI